MQANSHVERTFTESARRSQIVKATIETIGEIGYAKASFGQIAKRAGLRSTGMISYHFNGKSDLIAEVTKQILDASAAYMRSKIGAAQGPSAQLRAYIESNVVFIAEHRVEISAITDILHQYLAGDPDVAWAGDLYPADSVSLLEQRLRAGQRSGDLGEFDARIMAITIRQAIDGVHGELSTNPDTDVQAYADELTRIFCQAVEK